MTNEVRLLRDEIRELRAQLTAAHPCPTSPGPSATSS
jgi:hypothetical protein